MGDLISLMYPFRTFLGQALRNGVVPYWNPHTFAGSPFLANPISATFYPPNWLFLLLPAGWAWSLLFPLRLGLAAFFAALFGRRVGASRSGALLCGLVFSLSGFLTGWQGWPQVDCIIWAPLILLCLVEVRNRPTPRRAALLALALAMPLLAGHPEVCLYVLGTAVAFGLFLLIHAMRRGRSRAWAVRYVGALALGAGLAIGLCAVQLIPSFEWGSRITRALDRPWGPGSSRDIVALVSRDARSNPSPTGLSVPELCCYAGFCTLLLVPLAFFGKRRTLPVVAFFALLSLVTVEITFGLFPASQLFRALPLVRSLPGHRLLGLLDLSLAVLAGLGLSALQRQRSRGRLRLIAVIGAAAVCLAIGIGVLQSRTTGPVQPDPWRSPGSSAALLAASLLLLATLVYRKRSSLAVGTTLMTLLIAADLLAFSWGHVPFVDARTVFPDADLTRFLEARTQRNDRVIFLHGTGPWNVEMMYGLHTVAGYPQVLRTTARLLSPLNGGTENDQILRPFRPEGIASADPRLLDLLGVRWIVATTYSEPPESRARLQGRFPNWIGNESVQVYENASALPIAFLVPAQKATTAPHRPEAENEPLPPGFDPRESVILETGLLPEREEGTSPEGRITTLQVNANSVTGEARVDATSVLIMTQTWYPGWRAKLDGKETALLRADRAFCAMVVPAGAHSFEFSFYPSHFRAAIAMSSLSIGIVLVLLARGARSLPDPLRSRTGTRPRPPNKTTRNRRRGSRKRRAGP